MLKPFSENIIFFDTEFSSLDPYEGELLSVGLVKMTGEELYLEIEDEGVTSCDWVKEHVLPLLDGQKVSRTEACRLIREFIGDSKPYALAYVDQYDAIYTRKLFVNEELPFHWISLDFAPMLFLVGMSPEIFDKHHKEAFLREWGFAEGSYRNHHALDDARLLREVYSEFLKRLTGPSPVK